MRQNLTFMLALIFSAACGAAGTINEDAHRMHAIRIIIGEAIITATLDDTPSSRDFIAQLPLNIDLKDYASTEKIAYLPHKLSTTNAPPGIDPQIGDITYYAPWGNLAIFYQDFGYSQGLIRLGRITAGLEHLSYPGAKSAKVELATGH
ncbi:Cyclophilin (modular protein) [Pseudomonas sp. 8Z]|nr:Cyclophilin (modular protein) [Pseudomonas sp. 8Z]